MSDLRILLRQRTWWVDRQLRRHRIATMDVNHAANTAAFLRRIAPRSDTMIRLHILDQVKRMPHHDYEDFTEREVDRILAEPVRTWLETTPLMRALRYRASQRGPTPPFWMVEESGWPGPLDDLRLMDDLVPDADLHPGYALDGFGRDALHDEVDLFGGPW